MNPSLTLASASPRRRELLAALGLPFCVVASGADETLEPDWTPERTVLELAERKAGAVAAGSGGLVIGADTIVVCGGAILGKPEGGGDAARMLRLLRGRTHQVFTGVAVVNASTGAAVTEAVRSDVTMRRFDNAEIAAYVATGEPLDKAGGYGAQAGGGTLIERVQGCFNNVVGLPICALARLLSRSGWPLVVEGCLCRLHDGACCPLS